MDPPGEIPGYEFEGREFEGRRAQPQRLRYTPTVSRPPSGPRPRPEWSTGEQAVPGFEFDSGAQRAQRARAAGPFRPEPEWARRAGSPPPGPAGRSWFRQFRSALDFRSLALRITTPILAMIVFGISVVVIADVSHRPGQTPAPATLGYPPAVLAGGDFTAASSGRGISQTLGQVTSEGPEIVAVGSQAGARIRRAQFFVSDDGGRSWAMGPVRAPGGGPPPPGYAAHLVAGGHGAWVAVGPRSIWTSADGRTWTLSSVDGLPLLPGDQISVLSRTAAGFIAAGANVPGGDRAKASPVVFLSPNGVSWRRLDAARLHLAAGAGRPAGIRYAAAYRNQILIAGGVTEVSGRPGHMVTARASAAWLSSDGGMTWALAVPPAVPPAQISGVAATSDGFILARPSTAGARSAVEVYRSRSGTAWTLAAILGTPAGFTASLVNGGPGGAVVAGRQGRAWTAFVSADGASWRQTPVFGQAASESVSGLTVASGTVVAAGTAAAGPDSRQPLITVLGPRGPPQQVSAGQIPGAADPQLAVNGVAAGNGALVAVGSANGFPAAWSSADGGSSWTRAVGQAPAVLRRPGIQQLASVTYGAVGWLAVGGPVAAAAGHPVVVGSANGLLWQAADGEAAFARPGLVTEQAAAGSGGYVIVGYQIISGRTVAAAWWSAGLAGWRRAGGTAPGPLQGQAGASTQMLAVTAGPRGFVAVGSAGRQASAWTTPDGRDWTQVSLPLPVGTTRAVLQHVASNGPTLTAVGMALTTAGQQVPFAASSADGGAVWNASALGVPSGHAFVTTLAASGHGFIAAGTFGRTPGHQDVVVWTSADGTAWTAVTPAGQGLTGPGIQVITGLAASGSTLTGVGFTASPAGEQPLFWQSPIR